MHLAGEADSSDVSPLPGRLPAECGADPRKGGPPSLRMLLRPAGAAAQSRHRLGGLGDDALALIDQERLHIGGADIRAEVMRHKQQDDMIRRVRGGLLHCQAGRGFVGMTKNMVMIFFLDASVVSV